MYKHMFMLNNYLASTEIACLDLTLLAYPLTKT